MAGSRDDCGRPRGASVLSSAPKSRSGLIPPTHFSQVEVEEAQCLDSDLGEQDLAVLLPFRETEVLGSVGSAEPKASSGLRME